MKPMLEVFDPTTEPREQPITYVARPESLKGKTVGLVENTKHNSDTLLMKIGKILEEEYGVERAILRRKHNSGVPAHQEIIEEFRREVDLVVAGIGD